MLTAPIATEPQVAWAGHWVVRDRRDGVGGIIVSRQQQAIDFLQVETGQRQIELRRTEFLEFESEKLFVPRRPCRRPIHQQAEGFHLRFAPLIAEDHRDGTRVAAGPRSKLARRLQPEMAVHDLAVAARQDGDFEPELPDTGAHSINDSVILPRVPDVEYELVDRPNLNLWGLGRGLLQKHYLTSLSRCTLCGGDC